jgi:hypothetical protein
MNKIPCMVCATEIKIGQCGDQEENILSGDWEACTVEINGRFSSDFDLDHFHGVICTQCLHKYIPNLYKVSGYTKPREKYKYFPLGQNSERQWNSSPWDNNPQKTARLDIVIQEIKANFRPEEI